jgi:hypothetical protein
MDRPLFEFVWLLGREEEELRRIARQVLSKDAI